MAGSPGFKIYDDEGKYQAAARDAHIAAAVIGGVGYGGWTVKHSGRIIWREGSEDIRAGDSYDHAAEIMYERIDQHRAERRARWERAAVER